MKRICEDDFAFGYDLIQSALDGRLSESEAAKAAIALGVDEETLRKIGVSAQIMASAGRTAGSVDWILNKFKGTAKLCALIALLVSSGQLSGYTAEPGDTWLSIAEKHGTEPYELLQLNPELKGKAIQPGFKVVVPQEVMKEAQPVEKPAEAQPAAPAAVRKYTVVKGDTGYGIARKLKIKFTELKDVNPGIDWNTLPVGTLLVMPANAIDPKTDYLARVIYAETSKIATEQEVKMICRVIMNRVGRKGFPGNTDVHSIVSAPKQFSCTSGTDGNVNWQDYRKDLNSITERDYGYAEKMMAGDTSFMEGSTDIVFYCNRSLATSNSAVGKVAWQEGDKTIMVGHPAGFGDVVPAYVTKHFVFFKKK